MPDTFHLIDLASQALAVQRRLAGVAPSDKLAWLAERGTLTPVPSRIQPTPQVYAFESPVGRECLFFLNGDEFVFIGDNTTWTAKEP